MRLTPNYDPQFDLNANGTTNLIDLVGSPGSIRTIRGNGTIHIDESGDGPVELPLGGLTLPAL